MSNNDSHSWISRGIREMFSRYRKQARNRGYSFDLSKDEFTVIVTSANCFYCGTPPFQESYGTKVLGIDRKDSTLGYSIDNCVPCCKNCNFQKGSKSVDNFLKLTLICQ